MIDKSLAIEDRPVVVEVVSDPDEMCFPMVPAGGSNDHIVMGPEAFAKVKPHDGKKVFFIVTPGGRVYVKDASAMNAQDKTIFEEFNRNTDRTSDGALGAQSAKLDIQHERLDLKANMPVSLTAVE